MKKEAVIKDSTGLFLGIEFNKTFSIRSKKGDLSRLLLFKDESFTSGFELYYEFNFNKLDESRVYINGIKDTTISWYGNKMTTRRQSEVDSTSLVEIVFSGTNPDSLDIISYMNLSFKEK